jgi:NAD(P)-dependent dehydrogenase (short-subunit alcohol dehydrogenase family)
MARSRGGQGGAIVNLSTTAVRTGGRRIAAYVAAKAGIEGLMRALAPELAEEGIRINTVAPGIIATGQQPLDDAAWRASATASVPLGRLGSADEVAAAIVWLLSDAAAYVTGTVLDVAGGR